MERLIIKAIAPFARQIRTLAGRAVIRLVNDTLKEQTVQIDLLSGETREAERYQHYGFTSVPLSGAEGIALAVGGSRDHVVVIADGDRRYRLKSLANGEVAIYDDQGQAVHLKRSGIEIYGTMKLTVDAPNTEFKGNVQITGNIQTGGTIQADGAISSDASVADPVGTMAAMRTIYNGHVHGTTPAPTPPM